MRGRAFVALVILATLAVPGQAMAAPTCFGQAATIVGTGPIIGTPGDDVIVGNRGDDSIDGMGGNDRICGRGGNDSIESGPNLVQSGVVVWFDGGDGNDNIGSPYWAIETHLFGGKGADFIADNASYLPSIAEISGGEGDDQIASQNPLVSDAKTTTLSGGPGNDRIYYRVTADTSAASTLNITIRGGDGDDYVEAGQSVSFSPSFDVSIVIQGGDGNDLLQGTWLGPDGAATTTIENRLDGGAGDDELFAGSGASVANRVDGGVEIVGDVCYRGAGSRERFRRCEQII